MPPTLKVIGKLKATGYGPDQDELNKYVPINYIVAFIKKKFMSKDETPLSRMFLILATPGSGKTTTMVGDLFYAFNKITGRGLACTQPRVNTCLEKAKELPEFYTKSMLRDQDTYDDPLEFGVNIGYNTGTDKKIPIHTGITYMTSGVLSRQMSTSGDDFIMNKYGIVIVDEAHDKSMPTIELIDMVKRFVKRNYKNPACPIFILTTGTFDPFLYADYMLSYVGLPERYSNIISVEGSNHPIDRHFLNYNSTDVIATIKKIIYNIHITHPQDYADEKTRTSPHFKKLLEQASEARSKIVDGGYDRKTYTNVLVFDSGSFQGRIEKAINKMRDPLMKEYPVKPLVITRVNIAKKDRTYDEAFNIDIEDIKTEGDHPKTAKRKIIVATNVVETGATIDRLGYCVDSGWCKKQSFNPNFNTHMLLTQPVTKDMHIQRSGRVGRTAKGYVYAAFSEQVFNAMPEYTVPEIGISDCSEAILAMIIRESDIGSKYSATPASSYDKLDLVPVDILNLDSLDQPPIDMISYQLEKLFVLGCLRMDIKGEFHSGMMYPTIFGLVCLNILSNVTSCPIECARMLLIADCLNLCMYDIVLIASVACVGSFGYGNIEGVIPDIMLPKPTLEAFKDAIGDSVICCALILGYVCRSNNGIQEICDRLGCMSENVVQALKKREEIVFALHSCGINPFANYKDLLEYKSLRDFSNTMKTAIHESYKLNRLKRVVDDFVDVRTNIKIACGDIKANDAIYYKLVYEQGRKDIYYHISDRLDLSTIS